MTVKEFIEFLSTIPEHYEVVIDDADTRCLLDIEEEYICIEPETERVIV